jgi:hypothetical protein
MATSLEHNIEKHKKGLGNDFVSAGFSIARNEITTMTEPRYNQHVSLSGTGLNSVTISQLPELVFSINPGSPHDITSVNATTEGLFDKCMKGTWSNLRVDGAFLAGAVNTNTSHATFNFDVIEQNYATFEYDFELAKESISNLPLSVSTPFNDFLLNEQIIELSPTVLLVNDNGEDVAKKVLDSISSSMDLIVSKAYYINIGVIPSNNVYDPASSLVITDGIGYDDAVFSVGDSLPLLSWENPLITDVLSWFGGVYRSGTRIRVNVVVNPDGTIPMCNLFRSNTEIMGFTSTNVRPMGCYVTATPTVPEDKYFDPATGTIHVTDSDDCLVGTGGFNQFELYPRPNDTFESIRADIPDIIESRYILDRSSLTLVNGGSSYDSTVYNSIPPYFDWSVIQKNVYGTVMLEKKPDVSLQDIELMSVNGKSGGSSGTLSLSRFPQDNVYRGGEFLFSHPTPSHPFGFVSFLTSQSDFRTLDLKYFINPIDYPEYEHGLLQQLATDLCLHPYGNRYTENWSEINQQRTRIALTQLTPGNGRIAYMPFDSEVGAAGSWVAGDVGKTIRERGGAGEAIITALESTSNLRLNPEFDITIEASTTVISLVTTNSSDSILNSGYGFVPAVDEAGAITTYTVRVTSDDPTSTSALLRAKVSDEDADRYTVTEVTIENAGNFLLPFADQTLTIHYEEITTLPEGHDSVSETQEVAVVTILKEFTTPLKSSSFRYLSGRLVSYNDASLYELYISAKRYYIPDLTSGGSGADTFDLSVDGLALVTVYEETPGSWQNSSAGIKALVDDINVSFRKSAFHSDYQAEIDIPDEVYPDSLYTVAAIVNDPSIQIIDFYGDDVPGDTSAIAYVPSAFQYSISNIKMDFMAEPIFEIISGFRPEGNINSTNAAHVEHLNNDLRPPTGFSIKSPGPTSNWFESGEWGIFLNEEDLETQPYQLVYPGRQTGGVIQAPTDTYSPLPTPYPYNQQSHFEVADAISRIGSTFIVDSEKGTDLLSSLADIVPGKSLLPGNLGHPHAISNIRKPQKWRIKFQYNDTDASLTIYVATAYQILEDGTLTRVQGRDGIKGSSSRLPGELCEVHYDLKTHSNKVKEPFFNRRGKTNFDVENSYPMSYRLTCTDHGTAFFIGDQGAIDQDDDYAWFVVQRHADQTSGAVEMEDGKSPVHCVYSPAKRPEEFSDVSQNFFKSVLTTPNAVAGEDGSFYASEFSTLTSIEGLQEEAIYDVSGRKLSVDLETVVNITTMLNSVVPGRYFKGTQFRDSSYHDGSVNAGSDVLYNFAALPSAVISDVSHKILHTEGGVHGVGLGLSHGLNTKYLDTTVGNPYFKQDATSSLFDVWWMNAPSRSVEDNDNTTSNRSTGTWSAGDTFIASPVDGGASLVVPVPLDSVGDNKDDKIQLHKIEFDRTTDYRPEFLDQSSEFIRTMENVIGKTGFKYDSIINSYDPVMMVNLAVADYKKLGPAIQGLDPFRIWVYELQSKDDGSGNLVVDEYNTSVNSSLLELNPSMFNTIIKQVPKSGVSLNESEYLKFIKFDGSLTTYNVTGLDADRLHPLTSDLSKLKVDAVVGTHTAVQVSVTHPLTRVVLSSEKVRVTFTLANNDEHIVLGDGDDSIELGDLIVSRLTSNIEIDNAGVAFNSGIFTWVSFDQDVSTILVEFTANDWSTSTVVMDVSGAGTFVQSVVGVDGPSKVFGFGVEYQWKGAGNGGVYVNPYGLSGDNSKPVKDLARLTVTVNNQELEMVPTSDVNFIVDGKVVYPQDYTFQGTSLNSYIYYNDLLYLRYEVDNGTIVTMKYQNYSTEDVSVQNSYMIKLAEDRDMPDSWTDLHKFGKGIFRFVVRESDVLKPWDYHVSAILPQIDSPAIINPLEQLSITQDKSFVFNFPTPMASQRYIYPASEMDMICYSGADSSIQGGYTEVGQSGNEKYDLDEKHSSLASDPSLDDADISVSGNGDKLTFRSPYSWHLPSADYNTLLGYSTVAGVLNQKSHVDRRIYVGTYSTKPFGSGMRIFVQINGGSIRPEYSDNIDRKNIG